MGRRSDRGAEAQRAMSAPVAGEASGDLRQGTVSDGTYLRIDEVAKRTGLTKRTLRYYEEFGLLEPAQRSEGNYRLYRVEDLDALQRITEMRDLLGLGLGEIREMIGYELERDQARLRWRADPTPASRLQAIADAERITRSQLHLIEERLKRLGTMRRDLRDRLGKYDRLRAEINVQLTRPVAEPD